MTCEIRNGLEDDKDRLRGVDVDSINENHQDDEGSSMPHPTRDPRQINPENQRVGPNMRVVIVEDFLVMEKGLETRIP